MARFVALINLDTSRKHGKATNAMVINHEKRSEIARAYARRFGRNNQAEANAFFRQIFNPELLKHDALEDEAREWLQVIEQRGATICYVTYRPSFLQAATERWLEDNGIKRPTIFKNYGTSEIGPDGTPDNGCRYMTNTAWKVRIVGDFIEMLNKIEGPPEYVIFADDDEESRQAIAEIGDPRILIRCSLEDAATHDYARHTVDESTPPFLRRLQELAGLLDLREDFEYAPQFEAEIAHPQILGEAQDPTTSIKLEAWDAAPSAPVTELGQRFYRYSELYPQRNELSEIERVIALRVTCDQTGKVHELKMAKAGPALSLLDEMEEPFDEQDNELGLMQRYADEYLAHAILDHGYVESARAQRGMQIMGQPALDAYIAHVEQKRAENKETLNGHR